MRAEFSWQVDVTDLASGNHYSRNFQTKAAAKRWLESQDIPGTLVDGPERVRKPVGNLR